MPLDWLTALHRASRRPLLPVAVTAVLFVSTVVSFWATAAVEALLLRPLPYRDPAALVLVEGLPIYEFFVQKTLFNEWKVSSRTLEGAALYATGKGDMRTASGQSLAGDVTAPSRVLEETFHSLNSVFWKKNS